MVSILDANFVENEVLLNRNHPNVFVSESLYLEMSVLLEKEKKKKISKRSSFVFRRLANVLINDRREWFQNRGKEFYQKHKVVIDAITGKNLIRASLFVNLLNNLNLNLDFIKVKQKSFSQFVANYILSQMCCEARYTRKKSNTDFLNEAINVMGRDFTVGRESNKIHDHIHDRNGDHENDVEEIGSHRGKKK